MAWSGIRGLHLGEQRRRPPSAAEHQVGDDPVALDVEDVQVVCGVRDAGLGPREVVLDDLAGRDPLAPQVLDLAGVGEPGAVGLPDRRPPARRNRQLGTVASRVASGAQASQVSIVAAQTASRKRSTGSGWDMAGSSGSFIRGSSEPAATPLQCGCSGGRHLCEEAHIDLLDEGETLMRALRQRQESARTPSNNVKADEQCRASIGCQVGSFSLPGHFPRRRS